MKRAIAFGDVHLVGEICHCLKVVGFNEDTHDSLKKGMEYLRDSQEVESGAWPARDGADDGYTRYIS